MIRLTLPYPPSANCIWRSIGRGQVVLSAPYQRFKDDVGKLCNIARVRPLTGLLSVSMRIYRKKQSGDVDNRIKPTLDAMAGYCYANDDQIRELHICLLDDKTDPRVEVTISQLEQKP